MKKIFIFLFFSFSIYLCSSDLDLHKNATTDDWEVIIQNMYLTLTIPPQTGSFNTGREVCDVLSEANSAVKTGFQKGINYGVKELSSQIISFPSIVQGDDSLSVVDLIAKGKFEAALRYYPERINEKLFHEIDEITKKIELSNKKYQERLMALQKEKEGSNIQSFGDLYSIFLATNKLNVKPNRWSILLSDIRKTLKNIDDESKAFRFRVLEEATCFKEFCCEMNKALNVLDKVEVKEYTNPSILQRFERIIAEIKTMPSEQLEHVVDEFDKVLLKIRSKK